MIEPLRDERGTLYDDEGAHYNWEPCFGLKQTRDFRSTKNLPPYCPGLHYTPPSRAQYWMRDREIIRIRRTARVTSECQSGIVGSYDHFISRRRCVLRVLVLRYLTSWNIRALCCAYQVPSDPRLDPWNKAHHYPIPSVQTLNPITFRPTGATVSYNSSTACQWINRRGLAYALLDV